jgi:phage-related holin
MIDMFDMIETSSFLYWEIQLSLLLLISLSSAIAYESGVPVQSPVISHLL